MVLPYLQYCLLNWGNFEGDSNKGLRGELLTLQKSLVRIVCGANRLTHADPLFAKMGTLKVDDLFAQSVRIFSYEMSRGLLPGGVAALISKVDHGYLTRGASSNCFVGCSDTRSIRSIAPKFWNPLSQEMKNLPSVSAFKKKSKADLLAPYASFACSVRGCRSCACSV